MVLSQSTLAPKSSTTVCPFAGAVSPSPTPTSTSRGLSTISRSPISAPERRANASFGSALFHSPRPHAWMSRDWRDRLRRPGITGTTDCAGIIRRRERCSKSVLASNGVIISGFLTKRRVSCELCSVPVMLQAPSRKHQKCPHDI